IVKVQVWQAQVGRLSLYLLDTNLSANAPADQGITDQLYSGDQEMRIQQEIVLGIGGYRALQALDLQPPVYHMNEGHAAFLALERTRRLMETEGVSFSTAREAAAAGLIFTTHTPVPAGHDRFPPELMARYFGDYARSLGLSQQEFLALGRADSQDQSASFSMTILALKMAVHSNGVSRLHGEVSREMFQPIWPGVPEEEIPVGYVTNGVHFHSWISRDLDQLYNRYLGPRWREEPADREIWQRAKQIPAEELWRTHERRRERLVAFARGRLHTQLERRNAPQSEVEAAEEALDPVALTLGFARRFATYKRAGLLLRDPERLARLLNDPQRPVQVIFAGKAHPKDNPGKELIQQVVALSRQEIFRRRIVFLEDYDMDMARYLVQGADVWLNTPRRPLEASGTSGMKAMANGALNLSVLDGWWDEAWSLTENPGEPIGWAIGRGETYADPETQDQVEAEALYDLLEQDLIPMFYDRARDGLPRRWIARMKTSISLLSPYFNTHRMVREYTERFYLLAASHYQRLAADGLAGARALTSWKERIERAWPEVRVLEVSSADTAQLPVGGSIQVQARIHLGELTPEDVQVELYLGRVDARGEIVGAEVTPMHSAGLAEQGTALFEASAAPCRQSGLHGYTVRVLPYHPDMQTRFLPGLVIWANGPA
ncbi:MAG TPA: alpha-glucan family phosphorylase, partial [Anaerolineales bacterium]